MACYSWEGILAFGLIFAAELYGQVLSPAIVIKSYRRGIFLHYIPPDGTNGTGEKANRRQSLIQRACHRIGRERAGSDGNWTGRTIALPGSI